MLMYQMLKLLKKKSEFNMRDEDTINTQPAGFFAQGAAMDAEQRNSQAYNDNMEFFDDPTYSARVDAARAIIDKFFKVKDMYENLRSNRGNPFTVIKVTNHVFPRVSLSTKAKEYRDPLAELGVEIVYAKGTNSYLFRIR